MATAAWPLQQAVYARLSGDAALTAMTGVFDHIPEPAPYPHVAMGEITEEAADAHDRQGLSVALVLHLWSTYRGYGELARILARIDFLLDRKPLTVPGFTDVSIFREHHRMMRDPDPTIRHCPVRYRVWLTKEA